MRVDRAVMDISTMTRATRRASNFVADLLKRADRIREDAKKDQRLERHFCVSCFYIERIGGAAMTTAPCMCCNRDQMYGSTDTDVLCLDCARQHRLCKHCGGDVLMDTHRQNWPKASA